MFVRTYTPDEILRAVKRRGRLLVGIALVGSLLALAYPFTLSYKYRSVTTLQVVPQITNTYVQPTVETKIEDRLPAIGQQFLTRARLEKIVRDFNLYPDLRESSVMEVVIEQMRRDISFEPVNREVFMLGYTGTSPREALAVTERVSGLFIQDNARDRGAMATANSNFFSAEVEEARLKLEEQERKLDEYRARHVGQLPSQLQSNIQVLSNAERQLQTLLDSQEKDREQRAFLERQIQFEPDAPVAITAVAPPAAVNSQDPTMVDGASPVEQLATARANLRALELRFTPEYPDVMRLKNTVARLEAKIAQDQRVPVRDGRPVAASPAEMLRERHLAENRAQVGQVDRQLANKLTEEQRLRATISDYRARVDNSPIYEAELATLTRDYDAQKGFYTTLLAKKQDASIAASMEKKEIGDRFKVLEPARLPEKPFKPNRTSVFLIGLGIALALGIGAAAIAELRDTSVYTETDLASRFGIQVLATVPAMGGGRRASRISGGDVFLIALTAVATLGLAVVMTLRS